MMVGYATNETPECMPVTVVWAHNLNKYEQNNNRNASCNIVES